MEVKTKFNQFYIDESRVDGFLFKTQALEADGVLCLIQDVVDDGEIHRNFITIASYKIIPLAEAIIKHFKGDAA